MVPAAASLSTHALTGNHATPTTRSVAGNPGIVLALDFGSTLGWTLSIFGQAMSGTESFKPGRFEGGGMRYLRDVRWLDDLMRFTGPISTVYFEEVWAA